MLPSTTKLSEMLVDFGAATETFSARTFKKGYRQVPMNRDKGFGISEETYGSRSFLYIGCPDQTTRWKLEDYLMSRGVTSVHRSYSPRSSTMEIQVTYFKGWHWNE